MENQSDTEERHGGPVRSHRRELSWGVALPVAAMVITLVTWSHTVFVGLIDRITTIDRIVASNTTAHLKRDSEIIQMDARFVRLEDTVSECTERVSELRALSHRRAIDVAGE